MQIIYDLVNPQLLVDYVRAFDNEVLRNVFALDQILPNRPIEDLEFRIRQGGLQDTDAAEFRAWDTQPVMTGRAGVSRIRGELAPISRQIAVGEEEMLRLRALERGTNDPIISAIYDDAERMVRSVQARIELARGEVLTTGKVQIQENGLQLEADFNMPSECFVTASHLWTDIANAKPLTDMLEWQEDYVDRNGVRPGGILMSQRRLANFYLNSELRQVAQGGNANMANRLNLEEVKAVLATYGLPPISTYDTKVRVDGVQRSVLDPNKVIFLPPEGEPLGHTFYGITAEAIKLRSKGLITQESMPGIVALVLGNDNPVQTFTLATAVAVPVLPNPQLLTVATVAAD